jgi:heptaprenyl diphosphate synthase
MKMRKMVILSLLVAMGCGLFVLENALPPIAAIPGLKLGLANIITLLVMEWYGKKEAALALLCRILLTSLFAGQAVYFLYSIAGGICCFIVLCLCKRAPLWAKSAFAAIGHNLGQVSIAAALTATLSVYWLLLYLIIGAIISGSIIGLAAELLTRRFKPVGDGAPKIKKENGRCPN